MLFFNLPGWQARMDVCMHVHMWPPASLFVGVMLYCLMAGAVQGPNVGSNSRFILHMHDTLYILHGHLAPLYHALRWYGRGMLLSGYPAQATRPGQGRLGSLRGKAQSLEGALAWQQLLCNHSPVKPAQHWCTTQESFITEHHSRRRPAGQEGRHHVLSQPVTVRRQHGVWVPPRGGVLPCQLASAPKPDMGFMLTAPQPL